MRFVLTVILLFTSVFTAGCASVSGFRGLSLADEGIYTTGLPPVRQNHLYSCGAACVAAVAAYWGVEPAEFQAVHPKVPEDTSGTDLQEMAAAVGLRAFAYRGSMEDLRNNLVKGRPVIVMVPKPVIPGNTSWIAAPVLNAWNHTGWQPAHWVVVVGMTGKEDVIVHDPDAGFLNIRNGTFKRWWARKNHTSVLIFAD